MRFRLFILLALIVQAMVQYRLFIRLGNQFRQQEKTMLEAAQTMKAQTKVIREQDKLIDTLDKVIKAQDTQWRSF